MSQRTSLRTTLLAVVGCAVLAGCVERRYIIQSDPPGAVVFENGKPVGATPMYKTFDYYGTYRFTLVKDGYQTLVVDQCIGRPWYEYFPLDFFAENIWPWTIRDVRTIPFTMAPQQIVPPEILLERANQLKGQGQGIGKPLPPAAGLPAAPQVAPPPGLPAAPPL